MTKCAPVVCLLLSIILLCNILPSQASDLYVTPTFPDPKCPTGQPCLTLDELAQASSSYTSDKDLVTLHFFGGTHNLTQQLKFTRIEKLFWLAVGNETWEVEINCGATISLSKVSELTMNNVSIESTSEDCEKLRVSTTSFYLENIQVTSMGITVHSTGTIFIFNSAFNLLSVFIEIGGSSGQRETVIRESSFFDTPKKYLLVYDEKCDECQINFTLDRVLTNRSKLNESDDTILLESGDFMLLTKLYAPHKVNISECSFNRSPGTGITFIVSTPQLPLYTTYNGEIFISKTTFAGHRIGGLYVWFQELPDEYQEIKNRSKLTIEDCVFDNNTVASVFITTAYPGSALTILGPRFCDIEIDHTSIQNNVDTRSVPLTVFFSTQTVNITNSSFVRNVGTALKAYESDIHFSDHVIFAENTAYEGAGIVLVNSYIHFFGRVAVTFVNNTAEHVGGGILVTKVSTDDIDMSRPKCFYLIDDANNKHIYMIDNRARHGGDHIYGASLQSRCRVNDNGLDYMTQSYQVWGDMFHFNGSSDLSPVSSDHTRVCQCNGGRPNCTNLDLIFDTAVRYPGETFNINAVLVGDDFGLVQGAVYAQFLISNASAKPSILPFEASQRVINSCNQLQYTVHSTQTEQWEMLLLTAFYNTPPAIYNTRNEIQSEIDSYYKYGYIPTNLLQTPVYINVYLLPCPLGFHLMNGACECVSVLRENNIECLIQNRTGYVYRNGREWINASFDDNHTSNGVILHKFCLHQYCRDEKQPVDLEIPDTQCAPGHSGILCGGCAEGYSLVLGSQRCLQCSNDKGLALLVFFVFAGFILVLFIKLLDLTVARGSLNGLIFYANIVWINQSILFPEKPDYPTVTEILKVFIAWVNLDFGIETCFFRGFDAYWKTWLQFLFPFYIWTIAGLIVILSRSSAFVTRFVGNNSVPVLATLLHLSYAKLLRTIINVLELTFLEYPNGHRVAVWGYDGNVPYILSKHGPLFVAGVAALLFLWLPYTMVLFSVQLLRMKSNWKPLRWINKLKPFFDANFGPLKDRYHYWIGSLLLVRGFLFVIMLLSTTSTLPPDANLLVTVITTSLLLVHPEVYKKWYLSLLERSFFFNLVVFSIATFYVGDIGGNRTVLVSVSVGVAFVQFVVIVCFHAFVRVCGKRVRNRCLRNQNNDHNATDHETVHTGSQPANQGNRYVRLRESLLSGSNEEY